MIQANFFTYDELHKKKTNHAAQNLQKHGYGSKQVFSFMAKNSDHLTSLVFVSFYLGCMTDMFNTSHEKVDSNDTTYLFTSLNCMKWLMSVSENRSIKQSSLHLTVQKMNQNEWENLFIETGTKDSFMWNTFF